MGSPGPDFSLPDLQGNQVSLSSLKGKVVLLTFWSIWCGPCRQEMPMLESLYQKYRNEGLEVVGVNIDRDSISSIQDFLKKNRLSFPTLSDSDRNVMKVYRAHFLPTTFVLDRKGTIIEKIVGLRDWSTPESRRSIEKLLKGK
jgi:peroxiredoxin